MVVEEALCPSQNDTHHSQLLLYVHLNPAYLLCLAHVAQREEQPQLASEIFVKLTGEKIPSSRRVIKKQS